VYKTSDIFTSESERYHFYLVDIFLYFTRKNVIKHNISRHTVLTWKRLGVARLCLLSMWQKTTTTTTKKHPSGINEIKKKFISWLQFMQCLYVHVCARLHGLSIIVGWWFLYGIEMLCNNMYIGIMGVSFLFCFNHQLCIFVPVPYV